MTRVGDPIGTGFVSSLARPGGNVTGISMMVAELAAKRLALLREVASARRTAVIQPRRSHHRAATARRRARRTVAERRDPPLSLEDAAHLPETFRQMVAWRADSALWLGGQQQPFQSPTIELAAKHRLPVMVATRQDVEASGLISYFPDVSEVYRRTAVYVDRILRGAKPADLPVEQPTKFELVINLKTAKALGLPIPSSLLARADQVIE